jgi:hypothetical protein
MAARFAGLRLRVTIGYPQFALWAIVMFARYAG